MGITNSSIIASRIMSKLSDDNMAEPLVISLKDGNVEYHGIYFDGYRPQKVFEEYGEDIKNVLHVYKCRASDEDPMGVPVSIAPLENSIVVNFAGTFLCENEIPLNGKETEIWDLNYDWQD